VEYIVQLDLCFTSVLKLSKQFSLYNKMWKNVGAVMGELILQ